MSDVKRRGRPRKYTESDPKVNVTVVLPRSVYYKLKRVASEKSVTVSKLIGDFVESISFDFDGSNVIETDVSMVNLNGIPLPLMVRYGYGMYEAVDKNIRNSVFGRPVFDGEGHLLPLLYCDDGIHNVGIRSIRLIERDVDGSLERLIPIKATIV